MKHLVFSATAMLTISALAACGSSATTTSSGELSPASSTSSTSAQAEVSSKAESTSSTSEATKSLKTTSADEATASVTASASVASQPVTSTESASPQPTRTLKVTVRPTASASSPVATPSATKTESAASGKLPGASLDTKESKKLGTGVSSDKAVVTKIGKRTTSRGEQWLVCLNDLNGVRYKAGYVSEPYLPGENPEFDKKFAGQEIFELQVWGVALPEDSKKRQKMLDVAPPAKGKLVKSTNFMPFWEGLASLHLGLDKKRKFTVHTPKAPRNAIVITFEK